MGGCVTKNGAASIAADIENKQLSLPRQNEKKGKIEDNKAEKLTNGLISVKSNSSLELNNLESNELGVYTRNDVVVEGPVLKDRERRRLSLSQSDPVTDKIANDPRGQLVISDANTAPTENDIAHAVRELAIKKHQDDPETTEDEEEEEEGEEDTASNLSGTGYESDPSKYAGHKHEHTTRVHSETRIRKDGQLKLHEEKPPAQRKCRRLSVTGAPAAGKQDNFENKRQEVRSDTGYFDESVLTHLGIGYTCKKGLKPESPNQDDFFIIRVADWGLYGVFDGHGPYGHEVSNFVQRELPKLIYNDPNFLTNPKEVLKSSFTAVHEMLEAESAMQGKFDCSLSGTTATVVLHSKASGKLYVAHVGDSRCILGRLQRNGKRIETINLTVDHKPNCEFEKKRIHASGGQVRRLEGDIPHRVFIKGRLYPGLAMSRAIGDSVGRQAGVICDPDVLEHTLDRNRDLFICLCSDGIWEFLDSEEVAEMVFAHGGNGVQVAADSLAREAWNRWIQEEGNVVDDITAEIVFLNVELPTSTLGFF